jgi:hypothetical protein
MMLGMTIAHGGGHDESWLYGLFHRFVTPSTVCPVSALESAYLNRTLILINTLQANATYSVVFVTYYPNFIAYIKNTANQVMLFSNCTNFVNGLLIAKLADTRAAQAREYIIQDIHRQIEQIPRNVTGSNGPNDMDSQGPC